MTPGIHKDIAPDLFQVALAKLQEQLAPSLKSEPAHAVMYEKFGGERRLLTRFLRATGFRIHEAYTRFTTTLKWRIENKVDERIEAATWNSIRPYWPAEYCGIAKDGSVIQFFQVCPSPSSYIIIIIPDFSFKAKYMDPGFWFSHFPRDELRRFWVRWVEIGVELQLKSLRANRGPVNGIVVIYDLKDITRQQLELKGIRFFSELLGLMQHHYPENLTRAYILNTPFYFAVPWAVVRRVLSKETNERVVVCRDGCEDKLHEFIDPALVPHVLSSVKPPPPLPKK